MKYTLNEMQIMNLADHYTLLYAFLGKSLLEQCGEKGERALREGTLSEDPIFSQLRHLAEREKFHKEIPIKTSPHMIRLFY